MTGAPFYDADGVTVHAGDCRDVLRSLPDTSVDAVVTDPPYELGFMGKSWDGTGVAYDPAVWTECLRVLKPGGHLLAFGGTRTYHRLACAIEDAGFEIRDSITWLYGSGFPKSLDVSKAIDKAAGATREVVGERVMHPRPSIYGNYDPAGRTIDRYSDDPRRLTTRTEPVTAAATPGAARWDGWGTALKPASEPIVVARKPLSGTVAATVLAHGTGALNIDACRVEGRERTSYGLATSTRGHGDVYGAPTASADFDATKGRWPTNVALTHAEFCGTDCGHGCPVADLDAQSGDTSSRSGGLSTKAFGLLNDGAWTARDMPRTGHDDTGGVSRFFPTFRYEAKAPTDERPRAGAVAHPTVKPLDLMRWLVRLVTPPGGVVLDPFLGSGTTAEACMLEGFQCTGIEQNPEYLPLIADRLTRRANPVEHLAAKAGRGEDVDLGLFEFLTDGDAS